MVYLVIVGALRVFFSVEEFHAVIDCLFLKLLTAQA